MVSDIHLFYTGLLKGVSNISPVMSDFSVLTVAKKATSMLNTVGQGSICKSTGACAHAAKLSSQMRMVFVIQPARYSHLAMQRHLWETAVWHDPKVCWGTYSVLNKPMLTLLFWLLGLLTCTALHSYPY